MKAKSYKKQFYVLLVMAALLFFIVMNIDSSKEPPGFHQPSHQVTFLISEKMNIANENMKKGADTAANDFDVSLHFLIPDQGTSISDLLKEAKDKGSEAVIIAPKEPIEVDSLLTCKNLLFAGARQAIAKRVRYIGVNYHNAGSAIADEIIRHGNYHKKIYIVEHTAENDSIQELLRVMKSELAKADNTVELMTGDTTVEIRNLLKREPDAVLVALDHKQMVKTAMLIENNSNGKPELYGIGNSRELIPYIESGIITSTLVQDDFSIGYQAVECAVKQLNHETCSDIDTIRYSLIDKENIYSKEHEKLMFPFTR